MSDKFNELIELIISEESDKARDLFHEIVVEKSREIYEALDEEEVVDEAEEEIEENEFNEAELGGDAADDMIDDIEADEQGLAIEGYDDDEELEDRVVDLEDALDELKAEFERIMAGDDDEPEMDMDMDDEEVDMDDDESDMDMDDEAEEEDEMSEEMVREYKEKAPAPVTSEQGNGASGPVAKKNDMGGSAKNIAQGGDEKGGAAPKVTTQTDAANPKGATMKKA
jgi:hypothetical protein